MAFPYPQNMAASLSLADGGSSFPHEIKTSVLRTQPGKISPIFPDCVLSTTLEVLVSCCTSPVAILSVPPRGGDVLPDLVLLREKVLPGFLHGSALLFARQRAAATNKELAELLVVITTTSSPGLITELFGTDVVVLDPAVSGDNIPPGHGGIQDHHERVGARVARVAEKYGCHFAELLSAADLVPLISARLTLFPLISARFGDANAAAWKNLARRDAQLLKVLGFFLRRRTCCRSYCCTTILQVCLLRTSDSIIIVAVRRWSLTWTTILTEEFDGRAGL